MLDTHSCGKLRRHDIWRTIIYCMLLTLIATVPIQAEVTPQLNSDLIRQRFGNYQVGVLQQDEKLRVANLYSVTSGVVVCRTLAVTHFIAPVAPSLMTADARIRSGESIGATLQDLGFDVSKKLLTETQAQSGSAFELLAPDVALGTTLSINVYVLQAIKDDHTEDYAVIAEAYHPQHTPPALSPMTDVTLTGALAAISEQTLSVILNRL